MFRHSSRCDFATLHAHELLLWRSEPRRRHCLDSTYIPGSLENPCKIYTEFKSLLVCLFMLPSVHHLISLVMGPTSSRRGVIGRTACNESVSGGGDPRFIILLICGHSLRSFRSVPQWTCWGNCTRGVQRVCLRGYPRLYFIYFFLQVYTCWGGCLNK
jgi:hypothetical protein